MSNEKLAPCPFCGARPRADTDEDTGCYFVQCSRTGCDGTNSADTHEQAIAAWNRRSCSDCERMREALRRVHKHLAAISKATCPVRPSGQSELCGLIDEIESHGIIGFGIVEDALSVPPAPEGWEAGK